MSSIDLYGLIDVSRRLWENATGMVGPVHVDAQGTLLCPMCTTPHHAEPLQRQPDSQYACRNRHRFQATVLDD